MCIQQFVHVALASLAALVLVGCSGGDSVKLGTVPMTAIAPTNPINYPVGPSGKMPPSAKDVIPKNIPGKK